MTTTCDAVVVGAGPAGSAAALVLARAGKRVLLVERGPFPGSKNMYGGVVYGRVLDDLVPRWWEEVPVQRWVTRRATMMLTGTQSLTVDFRTDAWGRPPYNGCTTLRPDFDAWLAAKATDAGAVLVASTVATGLLASNGRVTGVTTDRPDGDIEAPVVIACDGVNSFLAKEAGLYPHVDASHFTLGAKEVLALPADEIDRRFGLRPGEGADFEIVGCTGSVPGGGFVYTNADSVAVGVVLQIPALGRSGRRPEEFIADLKAHPAVAPLVAGGDLKEYSAHLIPEGRLRRHAGPGRRRHPRRRRRRRAVPGRRHLAGRRQLRHRLGRRRRSGHPRRPRDGRHVGPGRGGRGLAGYRRRLEDNFVLADHRKLRRVPGLVLSDRVQRQYPQVACDVVESLFTVTNPKPKPGGVRSTLTALRRAGVRSRDVAADAWTVLRSFG